MQVEKEQKGKIKVVNHKPKTTFVEYGETRVRIDSFDVSFDTEKTPAKQITEFLLSTEGSGCLYQMKGSQPITYKLTPTKKEILVLLSKGKPIDTKTLQEQTGCANISREINHIREAINNKFGISGNKVIPPTKAGQGYVIAPSFVIVKRKLRHP